VSERKRSESEVEEGRARERQRERETAALVRVCERKRGNRTDYRLHVRIRSSVCGLFFTNKLLCFDVWNQRIKHTHPLHQHTGCTPRFES